MFSPFMRFRAADGASVRIAVVSLASLDSFRFAGERAEISLAGDLQLLRMFLGMNFMVKSGVVGLVVVDIVLIHNFVLSVKF